MGWMRPSFTHTSNMPVLCVRVYVQETVEHVATHPFDHKIFTTGCRSGKVRTCVCLCVSNEKAEL